MESIRAPGDDFDRGGTRGNRITLADATNLGAALRKSIAQDKETAALVFKQKLRTLPLKANGYIFSFRHQNHPTAFAQANNLARAQAEAILPEVRSLAERLPDMTNGRFNKATPYGRRERDPSTGKERVNWYLTFRTFLPSTEDGADGGIDAAVMSKRPPESES